MSKTATQISGRLQQFLFSPKGGVEGLLLGVDAADEKLIQVTFPADLGSDLAALCKVTDTVSLICEQDHSPKSKKANHPVYTLIDLVDENGDSLLPAGRDGKIEVDGTVTGLHFSKHGEPNGVILDNGDFVHLRPHGMKAVKPAIGTRVSARGILRSSVLGSRIVEAKSANGWEIE
jgi:hypothetical protein